MEQLSLLRKLAVRNGLTSSRNGQREDTKDLREEFVFMEHSHSGLNGLPVTPSTRAKIPVDTALYRFIMILIR